MAQINFDDMFPLTPKQKLLWKYIGKQAPAPPEDRIEWYLQKHPKVPRNVAARAPGYKVLWGGARGGGKSFAVTGSIVKACLMYPKLKTAIVRSVSNELERSIMQTILHRVPTQLYSYTKRSPVVFTWYNGSRTEMLALESEDDAVKIKGAEYDVLAIDEGNELDANLFLKMLGSLRGTTVKGFTPTLIVTANPGGRNDQWFKDRFIDKNYDAWEDAEILSQEQFVFIPARVDDNPDESVREGYYKELLSYPEDIRRMWLDGDWSVATGQFFSEWREHVHVVEPFDLPDSVIRMRGIDVGYNKNMTVCLWLAQFTEEYWDSVNETLWRVGDVVAYREYAARGEAPAVHAEIIGKMSPEEEYITATFLDPSCFKVTHGTTLGAMPVVHFFTQNDVHCDPANNERVTGWMTVKQWIHWEPGKNPRFRAMRNCSELIRTAPLLKYSKHGSKRNFDLDTTVNYDDAADAWRYVLATGFGYPPSETTDPEDLLERAEHWREYALDRDADNTSRERPHWQQSSHAIPVYANYES